MDISKINSIGYKSKSVIKGSKFVKNKSLAGITQNITNAVYNANFKLGKKANIAINVATVTVCMAMAYGLGKWLDNHPQYWKYLYHQKY